MTNFPERIAISPVYRQKRPDDFYLVDQDAFPGKGVEYIRADRIKELQAQNTEAMREAEGLAKAIHRRFYQEQAPQWRPLEYVAGIVSQIDNMTAGMADRIEELQARAEAAEAKLEEAMQALAEAEIAMLDFIELPDANCSCHISPPCYDCVENAQAREAMRLTRTTLAELKGQTDE